jgi:hypothetical protein
VWHARHVEITQIMLMYGRGRTCGLLIAPTTPTPTAMTIPPSAAEVPSSTMDTTGAASRGAPLRRTRRRLGASVSRRDAEHGGSGS